MDPLEGFVNPVLVSHTCHGGKTEEMGKGGWGGNGGKVRNHGSWDDT